MDCVYLNNAATSWPKAPGVAEAVHATLATQPSHPGRANSLETDVVTRCRRALADLLGIADPSRIILTLNATQALNIAIAGVDLARGAHAVATVTEHNSVLRPLRHLAADRGVRLSLAGIDETGAVDRDEWRRALELAPRLAVLNHASNVTGDVQDAASLLGEARAAGAVTLLDASQSLGHGEFRAADLPADLIAFAGHKGLLGPAGTGGLYVRPGLDLKPLFVGGTGIRSDLPLQPPDMPLRLEAGTPNVPGLAGLAAAAEWLRHGGEAHREQEQRLALRLRAGLAEIPGVRVFGGRGLARSGTVSFRIRGWTVEEAGYALQQSFGIACRTGLHCAPLIHQAIGSQPEGTVRFSVSGFNTDDEIAAAVAAVGRLAA